MDNSPVKTFKTTHQDRPDPHVPIDYCNDFKTQLRPYQLLKEYNRLYTDPECGKYPFRNNCLYGHPKLQHIRVDYPLAETRQAYAMER